MIARARVTAHTSKATTPRRTACETTGCARPLKGPCSRFCDECGKARKRKPVRYQWTPALDSMLAAVWAEDRHKKAVRVASLRTGYPPWIVKKRAQVLGLSQPRKKEAPWSPAEVAVVEKHAARGSEYVRQALAKAGFRRTLTAVVVKRKRLGCAGPGHGTYSVNAVAALLGVDAKTVGRWRSLGLLDAPRKRGTSRTQKQGGDEWLVTQEDLRAFVLKNAHLLDLRKMPPENTLWFVDLVSGGQAGLTVEAASAAIGAGTGGTMNGRDLPA